MKKDKYSNNDVLAVSILSLLVLLLVCAVIQFADAGLILTKVGAGNGGDCPSGSNYLSAWDGDYTSQDKYICYNSQVSQKDGTEIGTVEISGSYGRTGNGLRINASNERLEWPIVSDDILDDSVGTVCVDIYVNVATITGQVDIFQANDGGGAPAMSVVVRSSATVRGLWYDGSENYATSTGTVTEQTWETLKYTWDQPNDDHKICIDAACDEFLDAGLGSLAGLDTILLGEEYAGVVSHPVWIDNLRVYDTYDATCE